MLKPMTDSQKQWVDSTFSSMGLEEKVGHMMCTWHGMYKEEEEWKDLLKEVPIGSIFFSDWNENEVKAGIELVQSLSRIPLLVAMDIESGLATHTMFSPAMGCAAVRDPSLMRKRGRITAREARSIGVHWSFSPTVDIAYNFKNLETNTRAWGDTPEGVMEMVVPLITGMQHDALLAATAKHFPGTGCDDRDQHICTAVNPLPFDEWMATYGKVWRACFNAGVMSVMTGHISLPSFEGLADDPSAAMPATLSKKIQTDLLRNKLGFEGVIVSDAACMIGCASRIAKDQMSVTNLAAGGDVFLFGDPREEFARIMKAVDDKIIPIEQVNASARRVLEMKARLNVNEYLRSNAIGDEERGENKQFAYQIAEKSITVQRNDGALPAKLKKGAKILTVNIKRLNPREEHRDSDLAIVDQELRQRGYKVDNLVTPPSSDLHKAVKEYDMVFVNIQMHMHSLIGNIRIVDHMVMSFWEAFWVGYPNVVFTSFGSPYHLYELPHLPNMVLTYSASPSAQRAVVKVWLGEIEATGKCPVKMPVEAGRTEN